MFFTEHLWTTASLDIQESQNSRGKGRSILAPLYHFHLLHECLEISQAITVESSLFQVGNYWTKTGNL